MAVKKKVENPILWTIPLAIDLTSILKKKPPPFNYKLDHFYYIIDYLTTSLLWNDIDDNAGFVNVNAKRLQSVNHAYKKYLNYLLDNKIIRTDSWYIVNKKSTGYKLNFPINCGYEFEPTPATDHVINENVTHERESVKQKIKNSTALFKFLTKWFNSKLRINPEAAIDKIKSLYPFQTGGIKGNVWGKTSREEKRILARLAINKIANHEFYYSVDKNVGRFHSNLTNLKKELRPTISYDNNKIVNIDIKNAQPLLSTLLLNEEFYNPNSSLLNLPQILISPNLNYLQFNYTIMLVKSLGKADKPELQSYIDLAYSGEFYKGVSGLIFPQESFNKGKIKEMMFSILFSKNRFFGQDNAQEKREFARHFPSVYRIFSIIKRNNHSLLAVILQRIESFLIVNTVAKKIAKEKPSLPIFTIHDSIATLEGNQDYVSGVMKEEILRSTGLKVKLGIEFW